MENAELSGVRKSEPDVGRALGKHAQSVLRWRVF